MTKNVLFLIEGEARSKKKRKRKRKRRRRRRRKRRASITVELTQLVGNNVVIAGGPRHTAYHLFHESIIEFHSFILIFFSPHVYSGRSRGGEAGGDFPPPDQLFKKEIQTKHKKESALTTQESSSHLAPISASVPGEFNRRGAAASSRKKTHPMKLMDAVDITVHRFHGNWKLDIAAAQKRQRRRRRRRRISQRADTI